MTSQAVMKRYLTAVSKTEEYANNKTIQNLATAIANFKKLEKEEQAELNVLIEGAYKKLQAKGVSVKKAPTKTTTTRKTRTTEKGGLKAILAELKKKLGAEKFKEATTGTDIEKDIKIPALKKGKRIVRKKGYTTNQYGTFKNQVGTAYWESRANRFDANQPSQTRKYKLADGGKLNKEIKLRFEPETNFGGKSLATREDVKSFFDAIKKSEILDKYVEKSYYDFENQMGFLILNDKASIDKFEKILDAYNLKKSKHQMAKGGKIEVGSIVNLPEIKMKDGRVQFERVVGGEVIGFEDGVYDVLNPKTNRIHRVSKNQIEKPSAYSKHRQTASRMRNDENTYPKGTEFAKGGEVEKVWYDIRSFNIADFGEEGAKKQAEQYIEEFIEYWKGDVKKEELKIRKSYGGKDYKGEYIVMKLFPKYAKGGDVERGSAHIYITKTNGEYKVYHGSDVSLRKNAKPLYTSENNPEGTWDKIWSTLRGSKMADGGNTSKLTEAEREQAERELREAWEGKNADDYVMYSDKYKKGGNVDNIKVGDYVIVKNNPYWEGGLGAEKSYRRKVKMIVGEGQDKDYFFTDGSTSSAKYVHSIKSKKHAQGGTTKRIKRRSC